MEPWTGTVDLGTRRVAFSVTHQGELEPELLALLRAERLGTEVLLTATGPAVPLADTDAVATLAWLRDTYEIVSEQRPEGWGDDPRTTIPAGAVS